MVNKVILVGNLGSDPDYKGTEDKPFAVLSLATEERWKDKQGEKQSRVEWHRVTLFNPGLVKLSRYVGKGDKLYIEGELQTRKWQDDDGNNRYSTDVVLRPYRGDMTILSSKKKED